MENIFAITATRVTRLSPRGASWSGDTRTEQLPAFFLQASSLAEATSKAQNLLPRSTMLDVGDCTHILEARLVAEELSLLEKEQGS